ncbi:MAG: ATP-dependent RecD-like DNA helicase [Chlamydiales bacterium]|nr:ATP-dependent RecD-like DNA helicase [Chlamydiales bacterium]
MEYLHGCVERITFQNADTGYTVAQLKPHGKQHLVCIVGSMPALQPGETVRCRGVWRNHLVHGRQFEVEECKTEMPADVVGITKYLGSGLIKGIGPAYAGRIVDVFGIDTLDIIDLHPERLREVPGIGAGRLGKIKDCWAAQKTIRDVMLFLQHFQVSPSFAQKIFKQYGAMSIEKVKENPYNLARDIFGIGFKTADTIAQRMGMAHDSPERICAGVEHVLSQLSDEGHVCYPVEDFLPAAEKTLEVRAEQVQQQLDKLTQDLRIVMAPLGYGENQQPFLWRTPLYHAEVGIAKEMQRLRKGSCRLRDIDTSKAIAWVQKELGISLATKQADAVAQTLIDKVHIITGGPGTGKSTITKAILHITERLTPHIVLAAPTGRAAKRMAEITGRKASTIHSLLEFDFRAMGFKKNRDNPIDCDLIVIDEASMIDTNLMFSLLKAIPNHARVVFVGDINQLPSVGPGNVLKDMIASQRVPVTGLHEIFRQAAGSRIITNAHAINDGIFPNIENVADSDFFFVEKEEPEQVLQTITDLVTKRLPAKYGFCPFNDIQVLAPMKRGIVGTENLNVVLQERLITEGTPLIRMGRSFLPGDKVMQIRNDYNKEVFNGDVGRIVKIDQVEQEMLVEFDGRDVVYDFSDIDDLVLAYAVSIHKYQGSECPCIIIPVHTTHFKLLYRNLLYTGVTRGKRLVVLVGTKKAIAIAVRNDEVRRRYTSLRHHLQLQPKRS